MFGVLDYKKLGLNIKRARMKAGLTQEALAGQMKISPDYYRKLEHGVVRINLERLEQISELLSARIETFFAGTYTVRDFVEPPTDGAELVEDMLHGCSPKGMEAILSICGIVSELDKEIKK